MQTYFETYLFLSIQTFLLTNTFFSAAQKHMKDKATSRPASKKAKIETKPAAQSKQKLSKIKTDKKSTRRANSGSNSPSTACSTRNAVRDETKLNTRSPKVSVPPAGLSNSAPSSRPGRWPSALVRKCEKLLKELMDQEDSWPFLAPVDLLEV
jgi:hypothetical protein